MKWGEDLGSEGGEGVSLGDRGSGTKREKDRVSAHERETDAQIEGGEQEREREREREISRVIQAKCLINEPRSNIQHGNLAPCSRLQSFPVRTQWEHRPYVSHNSSKET